MSLANKLTEQKISRRSASKSIITALASTLTFNLFSAKKAEARHQPPVPPDFWNKVYEKGQEETFEK